MDFRCPHCGLETKVASAYSGMTGPCASCGRPVTIPLAASGGKRAESSNRASLKPASRRVVTLWGLGVVLCLTTAGWLAIRAIKPVWKRAQATIMENQCRDRLQRLSHAIHAYYADHGQYPPPYTFDSNGKRLHSWRVLILPYLGVDEQSLYHRIRLDEPWDSATNLPLNSQAPSVFQCPEAESFAVGDTSFCAVEGPGCIFDAQRRITAEMVTDGRAETISLIEMAHSSINWMEPKDVSAETLGQGIQASRARSCGSLHASGVCHVALANDTVGRLDESVNGDDLQAMATIAGGEVISLPPQAAR